MKLRFTYIPILIALAACSSDKEPPQPVISEEDPVYMTFSVTMEDSGDTRATRGETPDDPEGSITWDHLDKDRDGNAFECTLLPDYFTPLIVIPDTDDASGKAFKTVGEFKILSYWKAKNEDAGVITYTIHGSFDTTGSGYDTVDKLKALTGARLMVFANTGSDPKNNLSDFSKHTFTKISGTDSWTDEPDEGFDAIPMWGVSEVDFSNLRQGAYAEINPSAPCGLLRAMAKVQINLKLENGTQAERNVKITSVELNRINPSGNVLPLNGLNVMSTASLKVSETFNPFSTGQLSPTPVLDSNNDPVMDENGKAMVTNPFITKKIRNTGRESSSATYKQNGDYVAFYIPEIENDDTDYLELTLNYTVDDVPKTNHLYFTKYSGGGPVKENGEYQFGLWNVVRNHIYEFNVTGVQDSKISIEARVKDWQYHKEVQPLE